MSIKQLLKKFPGLMVVHAKIWTEQRNVIESTGAHDPLIGRLVSLLLCRREPRNDNERNAMQRLLNILQNKSASGTMATDDLTDAQLDAMLSAALGQIDYDVWKDFFALPDCGYAEDPEALRDELRRTRSAMREALAESRKPNPLDDPRNRIVVEDAREAARRKYTRRKAPRGNAETREIWLAAYNDELAKINAAESEGNMETLP